MKVINCTPISFGNNRSNLSFVNRLRDTNVQLFESLQKEKIEILLKLRETKKVLEAYYGALHELTHNKFDKEALVARADINDLEVYLETLRAKLREINLKILAEEEKNY